MTFKMSNVQSETDAAVSAVNLLLDHARTNVIPNLAADGDPYDRAILVALFARSVPLTEAIVRLGQAGYGREALMLNRALLELMLDAYWTHANPAVARDRFVKHARFKQHLQRETARLYPRVFGDVPGREELGEDELRGLKTLFGKYGQRSWTGLSTHQRAKRVESQFDEERGERKQLWLALDVLNVASNAELHPSAWSLGRALRRVPLPAGGQKLQFRVSGEAELVGFALRQTWWLLGQILAVMHTAADLPRDGLLDAGDASYALLRPASVEAEEKSERSDS
jgi:hypothetical protein